VVAAIDNADVVLLVTEPTPFGLHDLKLAVNLSLELGIPVGILVNRSDGRDTIIAEYAEKAGVPVIGRIPFRRRYAESYSRGEILAMEFPELQKSLLQIFCSLEGLMTGVPPQASTVDSLDLSDSIDSLNRSITGDSDVTSDSALKEIAIISGKGGTGKTTVAASFALLAYNKIMADCDVDAADLHLLLDPSPVESEEFIGGKEYQIDPSKCTACRKCVEACRFEAVHLDVSQADARSAFKIDTFACESCGFCAYVCPTNAISAHDNITGRWYVSRTPFGPLVHAHLGIGEENSGKLVTQVRSKAAELATQLSISTLLTDGPPGTGCPVIASIAGIDLALIVTEPTVSGAHDLERILKLCNHFNVTSYVVINKVDLNIDQAQIIEKIAEAAGSRVMGKIPFDRTVEYALREGKIIVEEDKGPAATAILTLWEALASEIEADHSRSFSRRVSK
jgi:MinD superfamily P-loop ATPase